MNHLLSCCICSYLLIATMTGYAGQPQSNHYEVTATLVDSSDRVLYNGIRLPDIWPPQTQDPLDTSPMRVPYLENPPEIIPIDVGRQLFVDDFLIETSTLERVFHQA